MVGMHSSIAELLRVDDRSHLGHISSGVESKVNAHTYTHSSHTHIYTLKHTIQDTQHTNNCESATYPMGLMSKH